LFACWSRSGLITRTRQALGPAEIDLPFFGKVSGPPERTYFHVGIPWSPWFSYWRVLDYQGPFAWNYQYGFNYNVLPGSAIPVVVGVILLVAAWIARRKPAPEATRGVVSENATDAEAAPIAN
jgi:hypothetical protein